MDKAVSLGLCEVHQSPLSLLPGQGLAIDSFTTAAFCDFLGDGFVATAGRWCFVGQRTRVS